MKKIGVSIFASLSVFLPALAFAQEFGEINKFATDINSFINGTLIPLLFAFALLYFLYGAFKYFIKGGGDEEARAAGTMMMVYAVIGFVLMISIWGIVNIIAGGLFGGRGADTINIPDVPTTFIDGGSSYL